MLLNASHSRVVTSTLQSLQIVAVGIVQRDIDLDVRRLARHAMFKQEAAVLTRRGGISIVLIFMFNNTYFMVHTYILYVVIPSGHVNNGLERVLFLK